MGGKKTCRKQCLNLTSISNETSTLPGSGAAGKGHFVKYRGADNFVLTDTFLRGFGARPMSRHKIIRIE